MQRRDFIKQVTTYSLAVPAALGARQSAPAFHELGKRRVMDLSGPWRLRMDPKDNGVKGRWFDSEPADSEARAVALEVPSIWQQYVDADGGIGWYFRDFSLPSEAVERALRIRFGAVDYRARVWLNGQEVGTHDGAFTPFEFDIKRAARAGENCLVVRVVDLARDFRREYCGLPGWDRPFWGRIDGIAFAEIPAGFQDWREGFNHCGIWQPVEIIAHDPVYVADAFILPKLSSSGFEARLQIVNETGKPVEAQLTAQVKPWRGTSESRGGTERAVRLDPGTSSIILGARIQNARFWSPDDPFLYVAQIAISEGSQPRDDFSARFGLRELTVSSEGFFQLNGKRIFLKGAHYQSTEPLTLAFPHDTEMARRVIEVGREGGFNFMRHQGRPIAPTILDAADELGIMLQSEPAVSRLADGPQMEKLATRETVELVKRDRNRPSIVLWNLINEQAPGLRVVQKMAQAARELDPTRLITESAGGPSHYYRPYSTEGVSYLTEHGYQNEPVSEGVLKYWRDRGMPGQLYFVTEYGFGALEDIDAVLEKFGPNPIEHMEDYHGFVMQKIQVDDAFRNTNASKLFPDLAAFREAAQTLQANAHKLTVESFRSNPYFAGFNVVQLFDSNSNEVDGLVDFWRNKRKKSFYMFQQLNQPLQLIVQANPFNPKAGGQILVKVTLVNEDQISGSKTLDVRVVGPSGAHLFASSETVEARPWSTRLFNRQIPVGQESGKVTIQAEIRDGSKVLLSKTECVTVYHPRDLAWPADGFALFDPQSGWPGAKNRPDLHVHEWNPGSERPQLVVIPEFSALWRNRAQFERFVQLVDEGRRGSTLLFMGIPSDGAPPLDHRRIGNILNFSSFTLGAVMGFGTGSDGEDAWGNTSGPYAWATGDSRSGSPVLPHPVFHGLPGPGLMDWQYGNVIAQSVPLPHPMALEDTGPCLKIVGLDNGKAVFCTFRVLEHLEMDGLAEKLFSNIVGYLRGQLPDQLRPRSERQEEWLRFHQAQIQDIWEKLLNSSSL